MKDNNITYNQYTSFSTEDFLQDDFFISSMAKPTKESENLWKLFVSSNPQNLNDFLAAKEYIQKMPKNNDSLNEDEISELWGRIEKDTIKKSRHQKFVYYSSSIAAAVLILIGFFAYYVQSDKSNEADNILAFVQQHKISLPKTNDALLILSKNNILRIKQQESHIAYNKANVKTDKECIAESKLSAYNQLIIPRGKRSMLTLSDGSKIWVNSGSKLVYPTKFQKDKREIYVDGEIYIEVTKDAKRPFYVRTKYMNVRVLGTKFNITAYETEQSQRVVLVEGRVQISRRTSRAILRPSQMYYANQGREVVENTDTYPYTSWVNGIYCFDNENLSGILNRLSTYYAVNVKCDPEICKLMGSGKIDLKDNFENVLQGLSFVIPIRYQYNTITKTYIIERKKN
ncbi:MAG: FecR family protein [Bacteroidales bacterium]|nr:FecR family protein [Bacteroidales bacterium]